MRDDIGGFRKEGFSLVELVIVIVIIGIIAAIAVPRISSGASGAGEKAMIANLSLLRKAIDLFAAEHEGRLPTTIKFVEELTQYTDVARNRSLTRNATFKYGPYLGAVPSLSVGSLKGNAKVTTGASPGANSGGGWWYKETTGEIRANLKDTEVDAQGVPYNKY